MGFLDSTGLSTFLAKLKLKFGTFKSVATGASKTGLQTAIYDYATGLTDVELIPIKFSTSNSIEAPFDSTTYIGFVWKSSDRLVVNAYGISGVNEDIVGIYKNSAWTWDSVSKNYAKKPTDVALDTVTNTSGSYTHTTTASGVTADMKAVHIEYSNPGAFQDSVTITTAANAITLECDSVAGTSDVTVTLIG